MAPSSTSPPHNPQNGESGENSENSVWKIQEVPGKGLGVVANQDIAAGTCIISEAPLITTEGISMANTDIAEQQLLNALKKLSKADQERFRSLHNYYTASDPTHPLSGICKSNGYPLGTNTEVGGVFADISRINHSCLPNTVQYWNPLHEKQTIHAVRPIPNGGEVTTSYLAGGTSQERKQFLKENFGFDCACEVCSMLEDKLRESDERLARAEKLDETLGDSKKVRFSPDEVMKSARSMFKIYEEEGIKDGRLGRLYYDLFQLCNMHSDLARARCFAKYYVDSKKMAEGKDSINVLEMFSYVKSPQKHDSFGSTDMWRTGTTDVPKGLKASEFAKWLWRENV
ncbi:SET domain-containing protein [Mollisia scopiformis]|uniref:SET domain-containing protein n=1 Tax=Mollisia scopiformis TaxID=149040 RepID=A0A194XFW6_MOLSC|nr:SET domain-containing protein [Mollisia scopiformis]KUJ19090.1 SET domain-containing protein [Mollisia scopiformis]